MIVRKESISVSPMAEYALSSSQTVENVRNSVQGFIASVGKTGLVLVTQAVSNAWYLTKIA
jgi:hypothetical protein